MASPLGVAAGAARLAGVNALEAIGRRPATAEDLAHGVTGLIRASMCPVCAALA